MHFLVSSWLNILLHVVTQEPPQHKYGFAAPLFSVPPTYHILSQALSTATA